MWSHTRTHSHLTHSFLLYEAQGVADGYANLGNFTVMIISLCSCQREVMRLHQMGQTSNETSSAFQLHQITAPSRQSALMLPTVDVSRVFYLATSTSAPSGAVCCEDMVRRREGGREGEERKEKRLEEGKKKRDEKKKRIVVKKRNSSRDARVKDTE